MAKIIFITGGERSGKTAFAIRIAGSFSDKPVYMVTSKAKNIDSSIEHLKNESGTTWLDIEEEKHLSGYNFSGQVVVLDCITLWLKKIFVDHQFNYEASLEEAQQEWKHLLRQDVILIVVTNEIGMGIHADSESESKIVELQGRMNQMIAAMADEAYIMVSGINVKIK